MRIFKKKVLFLLVLTVFITSTGVFAMRKWSPGSPCAPDNGCTCSGGVTSTGENGCVTWACSCHCDTGSYIDNGTTCF